MNKIMSLPVNARLNLSILSLLVSEFTARLMAESFVHRHPDPESVFVY